MTRRELGLFALAAVLPASVAAFPEGSPPPPGWEPLPPTTEIELESFLRYDRVTATLLPASGFEMQPGDFVLVPCTGRLCQVTRNDPANHQFFTNEIDQDSLTIRDRKRLLDALHNRSK